MLYCYDSFSDFWSNSLEPDDLDRDGEGGCKFVRVMLSLIMYNYSQLVYGALELLFRHFSQCQEVLQAFKQACVVFLWFSIVLGKCFLLEL